MQRLKVLLAVVLAAIGALVAARILATGSAQARLSGPPPSGSYPSEAPGYFETAAKTFPFTFQAVLGYPLKATDDLMITSVTFEDSQAGSGSGYFELGAVPLGTQQSCAQGRNGGYTTSGFVPALPVSVEGGDTVHMAFPQPLSIAFTKGPWCLWVWQGSDDDPVSLQPQLTVIGYIQST